MVCVRLISYISINHLFTGCHYIISFSLQYVAELEFLSLEVKYDIFRYGDKGNWQKHPDKYSQHKIVDPYLSSMSWTSCSWEKPSRWKNINTHTNIHTHAHTYHSTIKMNPVDVNSNTYIDSNTETNDKLVSKFNLVRS